jgi:CrcB protein
VESCYYRAVKELLAVGFGGLIGSIFRYKIGGFLLHHSTSGRFPLSTFVINVTGCFVIGVLGAMVERHDFFSPTWRLFLFTGMLGGYTTFSAFGLEGVYLLRRGEVGVALGYAMFSVIGGFAAVWIALKLFSVGRH